MTIAPIPEGYRTVTPYIIADGAETLIAFLERGLGATLVRKSSGPEGEVMNAEVRIGDSMVMLADARPGVPATPIMLYLYLENVDAAYAQAVAAGGVSLRAPRNEFYGDRAAGVRDPVGNSWWLATHVEDVSDEEIQRRAAAAREGA